MKDERSILSMTFAQGVDTKTSDRVLPNGTPRDVQNGVFEKTGQLRKRRGWNTQQGKIVGGGNLAIGTDLVSYGVDTSHRLLAGDGRTAYLRTQDDCWKAAGTWTHAIQDDKLTHFESNVMQGTLKTVVHDGYRFDAWYSHDSQPQEVVFTGYVQSATVGDSFDVPLSAGLTLGAWVALFDVNATLKHGQIVEIIGTGPTVQARLNSTVFTGLLNGSGGKLFLNRYKIEVSVEDLDAKVQVIERRFVGYHFAPLFNYVQANFSPFSQWFSADRQGGPYHFPALQWVTDNVNGVFLLAQFGDTVMSISIGPNTSYFTNKAVDYWFLDTSLGCDMQLVSKGRLTIPTQSLTSSPTCLLADTLLPGNTVRSVGMLVLTASGVQFEGLEIVGSTIQVKPVPERFVFASQLYFPPVGPTQISFGPLPIGPFNERNIARYTTPYFMLRAVQTAGVGGAMVAAYTTQTVETVNGTVTSIFNLLIRSLLQITMPAPTSPITPGMIVHVASVTFNGDAMVVSFTSGVLTLATPTLPGLTGLAVTVEIARPSVRIRALNYPTSGAPTLGAEGLVLNDVALLNATCRRDLVDVNKVVCCATISELDNVIMAVAAEDPDITALTPIVPRYIHQHRVIRFEFDVVSGVVSGLTVLHQNASILSDVFQHNSEWYLLVSTAAKQWTRNVYTLSASVTGQQLTWNASCTALIRESGDLVTKGETGSSAVCYATDQDAKKAMVDTRYNKEARQRFFSDVSRVWSLGAGKFCIGTSRLAGLASAARTELNSVGDRVFHGAACTEIEFPATPMPKAEIKGNLYAGSGVMWTEDRGVMQEVGFVCGPEVESVAVRDSDAPLGTVTIYAPGSASFSVSVPALAGDYQVGTVLEFSVLESGGDEIKLPGSVTITGFSPASPPVPPIVTTAFNVQLAVPGFAAGLYIWKRGQTSGIVGPVFPVSSSYQYLLHYVYSTARGVIQRSPLSSAVLAQTSATKAAQSISLTVINQTITYKDGRHTVPPCAIEVYRTAAGGGTFQFVGSMPLDPTVGRQVFVDTTSDDERLNNQLIYAATAGEQQVMPPSITAMTRYRSRLFVGTVAGDVQFSQKLDKADAFSGGILLTSDESPRFNPVANIQVDERGDRIQGLETTVDQLLIFTLAGSYFVNGDGPNAGLTAGFFPSARLFAPNIGIVKSSATVNTPIGAFFQSSRGIQHVGENLVVSYVGAGVEDYLSSSPVRAIVCRDARKEVWIWQDGQALIFNYHFNQWSRAVFNSGMGITADVVLLADDLLARITLTGAYQVELASTFYDSWTFPERTDARATYPMRVESGWIRFGELQEIWRVHRAILLITPISAHTLTVQIATNFDESIVEEHEIFIDAQTNVRMHLKNQKSRALKLIIQDTEINKIVGESYRIEGIAFEVRRTAEMFKTDSTGDMGES